MASLVVCVAFLASHSNLYALISIGSAICFSVVWSIAFFSRLDGRSIMYQVYELKRDRPYRVLKVWRHGVNRFALFTPVLFVDELNKSSEEYRTMTVKLHEIEPTSEFVFLGQGTDGRITFPEFNGRLVSDGPVAPFINQKRSEWPNILKLSSSMLKNKTT